MSENDTRRTKTPRKRATTAVDTSALKRTPVTGESSTRKRTTKKTAATAIVAAGSTTAVPSSVAAAPKIPERAPEVAAIVHPTSAPAASVTPASGPGRPVSVATGTRPDPVIARVVDGEERRRMIAEAAYHKFLRRGPGNGTPMQDWIEAEAEIDALLAEQQIVRAQ